MDVRVDLGLAADFLQFDTTTNSFTVATDSIDLQEHCGTYEICAQILFKNTTYIEQYSDCFQLTIECPEETVIPFEFPV